MPPELSIWQWALLALGAGLMGLSKTGIAGIGILAVAIFALVLPARESVGIVLVILISADIVAVTAYRRHAVWPQLWRIFPWAAGGVVIGAVALGRIDDAQVAKLVGAILLALVILQWWRRDPRGQSPDRDDVPHSTWFAAGAGLLAGFTTMVANAAGPIMILYLLAMRLPKMAFIGTSAWYFLVLNLFKVPFSAYLGLINLESLRVDLVLAPIAILGALFGRAIIGFIDQRTFEMLAIVFTLIAAVRLLL